MKLSPILFLLVLLLPGCIGFNDGGRGWNVGPFRQEQPEAVVEEEPYDPDDWIGPVTPRPTTRSTRSSVSGLSATPIGPPPPGRQIPVVLRWQHDPTLDGATEYRVYWSRQPGPGKWEGFQTITVGDFQVAGRQFTWNTSQPGTVRFVATATRPSASVSGAIEESDPSNEVSTTIRGFPNPPRETERIR